MKLTLGLIPILALIHSTSAVSAQQPRPVEIREVVSGYSIDEEVPGGRELAQAGFREACKRWRESAGQQLGRKLIYTGCGAPASVGHRFQYKYASETAQIHFEVEGRVTRITEHLSGEWFEGNESAARSAQADHERVCQEWLEKVREEDHRLIYASCGGPMLTGILKGYQFESQGVAVFQVKR